MAERVALYVIRAFFVLVCAGVGLYGAAHTAHGEGYKLYWVLGACGVSVLIIGVESFSGKTRTSTLSSVIFGLVIGLVLSSVFEPVNELILESFGQERNAETLRLLQLVTMGLFFFFGVTLLLHTRGRFKFIIPYVEFRKEVKEHRPLLLDTSALIDGRIEPLLESGLLDCRVLVPGFVVEELQMLSDASDKVKRERGRRGLRVLEKLRKRERVELMPLESQSGDVDAALLECAVGLGGWVVTTDANLSARGEVEGVKVINLNNVAETLRIQAIPGETVELDILRKGEEPGQGVGFLPDGTMVVVEGGEDYIGKSIKTEVTGAIRTSAGRLVFAKPKRGN